MSGGEHSRKRSGAPSIIYFALPPKGNIICLSVSSPAKALAKSHQIELNAATTSSPYLARFDDRLN
jgi:hypothetical protein